MPRGKLHKLIDQLKANCFLGRKLVVVIGAGVSRGVGAPGMGDIHAFLRKDLLGRGRTQPIEDVLTLLEVLLPSSPDKADKRADHPRSVMVRLYHLLQSSDDPEIRKTWEKFGIKLVSGKLREGGEPFWRLQPSRAHYWAARLACTRRAVPISLNYDGLTRDAIDSISISGTASESYKARILSEPEEILKFFADPPPSGDAPVPLIKFRGDVFHAVCRTLRCPESEKRVPLYHLLDRVARATSQRSDNSQKEDKSHHEHAVEVLRCPVCMGTRGLEISFPGVFGKEEAIERAIHAMHRVLGSSIAGVAFLGFSGDWDETLVKYLVQRAKELNSPVFGFSRTESGTLPIERAAERAGWGSMYKHVTYRSEGGNATQADEVLDGILDSKWPDMADHSTRDSKETDAEHWFPGQAFPGLGTDNPSKPGARLRFRLPNGRTLTVCCGRGLGEDSFAGMAGHALVDDKLDRLRCCSQLGAKSAFLREPGKESHTRFDHSASTGLLAMVWYEALKTCMHTKLGWAWSEEARLALEMAALYHDARHLPFSHMMEEIFQELNWEYGALCYPEWGSGFVKERLAPKLRSLAGNGQGMQPSGFWEYRVQPIQRGGTGVPWLDAIVDGALDVDKIEYVFHDAQFTGQNVRLSDVQSWMSEFLSDQSLTPEGLIRLEGDSALAAIALLEERMHLYRRVYLAPELRGLEALVKYIVMTWLKWRMPTALDIMSHEKKEEEVGDWRTLKADTAAELLWSLFPADENRASRNELAVVGTMVAELEGMQDPRDGCSFLDKTAIAWLKALWNILEPFTETPGGEDKASWELARKQYAELAPVGPFYAPACDEDKIRKVIRRWRVHSPLLGIVDLARFPEFLATPRHRDASSIGQPNIMAEQFLVPGERPSEWRIAKNATVPLHDCDFGSFEMPVVQMLILDPWGRSAGGSEFLHQMLSRELRDVNVKLYESPERARESARGKRSHRRANRSYR